MKLTMFGVLVHMDNFVQSYLLNPLTCYVRLVPFDAAKIDDYKGM